MIRYVRADTARTARGLVAQVFDQIQLEFGVLGEPLTLHSPVPDVLAGVWCSCRESLLCGTVPRRLKEAVAVAVSQLNRCSYCVDAHAVLLRATSSHGAAWAIQNGHKERITDEPLRRIVSWAMATLTPGSSELANPPFGRSETPEIIGTAIWIHYINRMSRIFVGERLIPLSGNYFGLRSFSERLGGMYFAGVVHRRLVPGESLNLIRLRQVSEEFRWAEPSPAIAQAFSGFAEAADEAASLSPDTRACVAEAVGAWDGGAPALGGGWVEGSLRGLSAEERPGARLALLAALAPERIDESSVREFRRRNPTDQAVVGTLAWGSLTAARRIASWLHR